MVTWGDPQHIVGNGLTGLVFAAATVWIFSPAGRRRRRHGWRWALPWLLCLALSLYFDGYYIPLGPVWILREAQQAVAQRRQAQLAASRVAREAG